MRRRVYPGGRPAAVEEVELRDAAALVTLADPAGDAAEAAGAFARLRPPEGTAPDVVSSWRSRVERVALAVRVLPPPSADDVPAASLRPGGPERTFREEALALAEERGDPPVSALVRRALDLAGA